MQPVINFTMWGTRQSRSSSVTPGSDWLARYAPSKWMKDAVIVLQERWSFECVQLRLDDETILAIRANREVGSRERERERASSGGYLTWKTTSGKMVEREREREKFRRSLSFFLLPYSLLSFKLHRKIVFMYTYLPLGVSAFCHFCDQFPWLLRTAVKMLTVTDDSKSAEINKQPRIGKISLLCAS